MSKYLRCRTCDIQLQDTKDSTFFIEHMNKNEYICLNKNFMKEYLRKKGVTGSEHPQVIIRLNSGKVGVDINTTHLLFSGKLNLIKLALQNYNYEFEIINYEKQT